MMLMLWAVIELEHFCFFWNTHAGTFLLDALTYGRVSRSSSQNETTRSPEPSGA
jgi:hypothetical protein